MTPNPKTLPADALAVKAVQLMEEHRITSLMVVGDDQKLAGVVHIHALVKAGLD